MKSLIMEDTLGNISMGIFSHCVAVVKHDCTANLGSPLCQLSEACCKACRSFNAVGENMGVFPPLQVLACQINKM